MIKHNNMASNDSIQLNRKELNDLISKTIIDLLKQNLENIEQIISIHLSNMNNVCSSSMEVPVNFKLSISIIGVSEFNKPSPNAKNNNTGVNTLEYLKLISNKDALSGNFTQLSSIKVANYINTIVTIPSKFIVLRYALYDGIKLLFDFMKCLHTPMKYSIIFKIYENEKDGLNYSHNGHILCLVKDDMFYFIDIDNNIYQPIDVNNYNSIDFNKLYPSTKYNYIDIIYTLRENFENGRPCDLFHPKNNIVNENQHTQSLLTNTQVPTPNMFQPFQATTTTTPNMFQPFQATTTTPTTTPNMFQPFQTTTTTAQKPPLFQPSATPINQQKPPLFQPFQATTTTPTTTPNMFQPFQATTTAQNPPLFQPFQATTSTTTPNMFKPFQATTSTPTTTPNMFQPFQSTPTNQQKPPLFQPFQATTPNNQNPFGFNNFQNKK